MQLTVLKSDFYLALCCVLAAIGVSTTFIWMESQPQWALLNADRAMNQAEESIASYCAQNGMSSCDMKLVDVSAGETEWKFEYYSPTAGQLKVEVSGEPSDASERVSLQSR